MANRIYKYAIGVALFCILERTLLAIPILPYPIKDDHTIYGIYLYLGGNIFNANMICIFLRHYFY